MAEADLRPFWPLKNRCGVSLRFAIISSLDFGGREVWLRFHAIQFAPKDLMENNIFLYRDKITPLSLIM